MIDTILRDVFRFISAVSALGTDFQPIWQMVPFSRRNMRGNSRLVGNYQLYHSEEKSSLNLFLKTPNSYINWSKLVNNLKPELLQSQFFLRRSKIIKIDRFCVEVTKSRQKNDYCILENCIKILCLKSVYQKTAGKLLLECSRFMLIV